MIKGRYVALVEIDFYIDEEKGVRPFNDIKSDVMNGKLTKELTDMIEDEIDTNVTDVKITQQYADLYRVEDGDQE